MKTITVRQLLREFKTIFPLPPDGIEVKRKEDSFYIYPKTQEQTELLIREVPKPEEIGIPEVREVGDWVPSEMIGWCQGPIFEKGVNQRIRRITYEDENANPAIKEKWYCDKCIKALEDKGVGRVYYL